MPYTEDNMNNLNNTDNINITNHLDTITVSLETGEVIENAETAENKADEAVNGTKSESPKEGSDTSKEARENVKLLFFEPRKWKPAKKPENNVTARSFISNPFGEGLTEAYTIGDWNFNWSEIETADMPLEKNTDYEFVFWLNGGECENSGETSRLELIFDNDYENRYTYNLNRSFIRYERHYKGWYLYRIPFNTEDSCYTKLKFISMRSYMSIIKAEAPESYSDLPEDNPPEGVPQRHNIVFKDGFPLNAAWSYKIFGKNNTHDLYNYNRNMPIEESIREAFEESGIKDDIADEIIDQVMDDIDFDGIKDQIIQEIKDKLNS